MAQLKSNLWSSLIQGPVWDKYKTITRIKTNINTDLLLETQIKKLQALEGKTKKQFLNASNFLKNIEEEYLKINDQIYNLSTQQIMGRILEILNLGLWGNELNPTRRWINNEINEAQRDKEANQAIQELQKLLIQIKVSEPLQEQIINDFENRIRKQKGNNQIYTQIKADYAEKLMVDLLSKNPNWITYQTGKWAQIVRDKTGKKTTASALIEDTMSFNKNKLNQKFGLPLSYTVKYQDGKTISNTVTSLKQFLDVVDKLDIKAQIQLEDPLYEAVQKASELSTQVKSGRNNQPILSRAKRNAITLDNKGNKGIGFFQQYTILEKIYQDNTIPWIPLSQQNSKELDALANYQLSKEIHRTNIAANALYYTEQGFVTASEWMSNTKQFIKFSHRIGHMGEDFIEAERQYKIAKSI